MPGAGAHNQRLMGIQRAVARVSLGPSEKSGKRRAPQPGRKVQIAPVGRGDQAQHCLGINNQGDVDSEFTRSLQKFTGAIEGSIIQQQGQSRRPINCSSVDSSDNTGIAGVRLVSDSQINRCDAWSASVTGLASDF